MKPTDEQLNLPYNDYIINRLIGSLKIGGVYTSIEIYQNIIKYNQEWNDAYIERLDLQKDEQRTI